MDKNTTSLEVTKPPEKKTAPPWATEIDKPVFAAIILIHITGFMTLVMMYFGFVNWINVVVFFVLYCVMGLGITMGFHRYFTHKSFDAEKETDAALAIAGHLSVQGPLIEWVRKHRAHHRAPDVKDVDPHTPENGFWWAHFLWNIYKDPEGKNSLVSIKDLEKDPFLVLISRFFWVPQCVLMIILFSFGLFYKGFWTGVGLICTDAAAVTCVYHATWSINSFCHMKGWWGKRNFETKDHSRDSFWVALITFGEGYHNFHHEQQGSARHGIKRFAYDPTYWGIKLLKTLGRVSNIREPRKTSQ